MGYLRGLVRAVRRPLDASAHSIPGPDESVATDSIGRVLRQVSQSDFQRFMARQPIQNAHAHILLACFPKSGSTYLSTIIGALPGFHLIYLLTDGGRREQELSFEIAARYHSNNYVTQNHVRYSVRTQRFMDVFGLKPVFLVRNIFDALVSLDDHIFREDGIGPQFQLPAGYTSWSEGRRLEFLTDMAAPWYINLFMSWTECSQALRLSYEALLDDTYSTVRSVCAFAGIEASDLDIRNAIDAASRQQTRRNVGIKGRGDKIPEVLRRRVRDMCRYYPEADFSAILPPD